MTNGYVIYVVDTETTGLDPVVHDIIEISMTRLTFDEQGESHQEQKTWLLKAQNASSISDEALNVNGHKREDILHLTKFGKENYHLPAQVIADIELWVMEDNVSAMDRIFVGQNPYFDIEFLKQLWKKLGTPNTFPFELDNNNRTVDTKQIAVLIDLCTGRRRLQYNLSALVKAFGVKKGKAHKASEDVRMTTDLLITFLAPLRPVMQEKFKDAYPQE